MDMKIIKVVDTRVYEEGPDEKWYPIPGSGEMNICSRCGKGHEIHVTVEESEGKFAVVGLGCAQKENLISDAAHKSLASASISLAKNKAQLEKLLKTKKIQDELWSKVETMEHPSIEKGEFRVGEFQVVGNWVHMIAEWKMEDASMVVHQEILKEGISPEKN